MRTTKPITVTLGRQQPSVERRVASGDYESASEVIRAAIRALDREEKALHELRREQIRASLADTRPDVPAEKVFARLRARHRKQVKASSRGA